MITEEPQYPHFMVMAPCTGSSGAPQVGHLKARMDASFAIFFHCSWKEKDLLVLLVSGIRISETSAQTCHAFHGL